MSLALERRRRVSTHEFTLCSSAVASRIAPAKKWGKNNIAERKETGKQQEEKETEITYQPYLDSHQS
jgi:hypothetical protein